LTERCLIGTNAVPMGTAKKQHVVEAHVRLFAADIEQLKKIAAERGSRWQFELRLLVKRALAGERREVVVLKES